MEVKFRIYDIGKFLGVIKILDCRAMGCNVKRELYEGVAVQTALYGAEIWSTGVAEKKRLNVMEMRCVEQCILHME